MGRGNLGLSQQKGKDFKIINSFRNKDQMLTPAKSPPSKTKKVTQPKVEPETNAFNRKSEKAFANNFNRKQNQNSIKGPSKVIKNATTKVEKVNIEKEPTYERTTFPNNDWYEGPIEESRFSGSGKYFMAEQKLEYHGQFKRGLFEGEGVIIDPLIPYRQLYSGQWKEGKKHGKGLYNYSDNEKYDGEWYENDRHGFGSYESHEGEYVGDWKNDKKHGKGTLKLKKGISLIGTWVEDNFREGKIIYSDGSMYYGTVFDYLREGKGEYEYADGSNYKGEWRNNQKEGRGIFEFSNGDTYEGEFRGNQKHGKDCLYRWKEGSEMRNVEYVENQFHSGNFFEVGDSKLKPMEFSID